MSFTKFYVFIFLLFELQNVNETISGSGIANEDRVGLAVRRREITNGNETDEFNFLVTGGYRPTDKSLLKYLVSIRFDKEEKFFGDNHLCGGVIISKRDILTAAHCIFEDTDGHTMLKAADFTVIIGTPKRLQRVGTTQEIGVAKLIPHSEYETIAFLGDIAIMILKEDIRIDGLSADVISLTDSFPIVNTKCHIMGWGNIIEGGPIPDEAVFGDVTIQPFSDCQRGNFFDTGMICAKNPIEYEVDACQGDSGGPLICNGKSVGIVSHGEGCGLKTSLGIYTDVYHYRNWILENMENKENQENQEDQENLENRASAKGLHLWLPSIFIGFLISNRKTAQR